METVMRTRFNAARSAVFGSRPTERWVTPLLVAMAIATMALLLMASLWTGNEARGQPATKATQSILGAWNTNCECSKGMVIELVAKGNTEALGRIKVLGKASDFKYTLGENVLQLKAGSHGIWKGLLLWRNTNGVKRWQPITMRFTGGVLHGVSENDHCYENMQRSR